MVIEDSQIFSYLQFAITGLFKINISVECPEGMIKEYYIKLLTISKLSNNNEKSGMPFLIFIQQPEWTSIYAFFAFPLIMLILYLNRKEYVESYGIRLFTNFYLGIHGIRCILFISENIYKYIWAIIYTNNIICTLQWDNVGNLNILLPKTQKWGEFGFYSYPRVYIWLQRTLFLFDEFTMHIFPWILILHRITTYCACSQTFFLFHKKWFNQKLLRIYYIFLVISTFFFIYCKRQYNQFFSYSIIQIALEQAIIVFETLIHIIITVLSVHSVSSLRYNKTYAKKELKYFLYFSIFPTLTLTFWVIFQIFVGSFLLWEHRMERVQLSAGFNMVYQITQALANLLSDLRPIYDSILLFICVPIYRKTLVNIFSPKKHTVTVSTTVVIRHQHSFF